MIDINFLREKPKEARQGLVKKGRDSKIVDQFLDLDKQWRGLKAENDQLKSEQKKFSKDRNIKKAKELKNKTKSLEERLSEIENQRQAVLNNIPNMPLPSAPEGKSEADNVVAREFGKKIKFSFTPKDYLSLAERLDIIDVKRAAKVSGSRFGYFKKAGALLEIALINFAFEVLLKEGFVPVIPPVMIKPDVFKGMGRLAGEQKEERYYLPKDDLYLAGSAEHTIGPLHKDEILNEKELPRRYLGFSTCFRREAGSYGKDTRGILRVHQFDKVEMFSFCRPEDSGKELEKLVSLQEKLMRFLELPFRVVEVCAGDMGWTDARQFDIEVWLPGQNAYKETNSASNTTDFQARGINARFKDRKGSVNFVHMLNATAFAVGRTIIAIIENYQTEKGTVKVPKVLQKYFNLKEIS